jgi:hypothetical protein
VNEYNGKFYHRHQAEYLVRKLSQNYQNSYNIVFFACCREQQKQAYDYLSVEEAKQRYKDAKGNR